MMMSNKKKVEETDPIARELIGLVQTGFNLLKQVLKDRLIKARKLADDE